MWITVKRLALGLALIVSAAAVLLVTDWNHRNLAHAGIRKWKISVIEYVNVEDVEETEKGFLAGLPAAGLKPGRDYEVSIKNAQGDMNTLNSAVDAAITEGADLLVPFSTPSLQVAARKAGKLPVVFAYVADAVSAGAGTSNDHHLANITGVTTPGAYAELIGIFHRCFPNARRVGTIFVPAESNTVFHRNELAREAQKLGIELVAVPANTSSELPDAALALCGMRIDGLCQVGGNILATGFVSIVQAANRAHLPVFAFLTAQARQGATLVVGRDYYDGGKEAAELAARIMRGESPAAIPFEPLEKSRLVVNLRAAEALGMVIPPDLVKRADEVIRQ